ncbi:insulin-like growth factor-binding protein complex acid labile subunit [Branchiostoma floridae]|uniref:Insulin-like growth factor-binding protein complex acid labile subunit n=1 Tax=Branchiostoma floridae TaxID=7739 RepID=A0A9J7HRY8_BRAFL|nr:insulin-like growth factor-binding protein complex acid labile subunit [Branchiostoma floridae]
MFLSVLLLLYSLPETMGQMNEPGCTQYSTAFQSVASCVGLQLTEVPSNLPSNITELNLNNNSLSHIRKGDFLRFRHLTTLHLSQNNITLIQEKSLSGPPLVNVFLRHNRLENIPEEVLHIHSLKYLNLENNQINNLTVPLGKYRTTAQLRVLVLKNTQLSLLQGHIFASMNLQSLDLSFNKLESLPHLVFGKLNKKLETLTLAVNRLSDIPSSIHKLTVLQHLDLSYNKIKRVAATSLTGLQNLKTLYLSGNGIISIADNAFSHLRLTRLNLSSNKLTTIPTPLTSMASMTMLSLGGNPLGQIQPGILQSMPALHTLELEKVGLSYLPSGTFSNSSLTHLNLAFNKLQGLPMDIFSGTALRVLQLQGNQFSQFPRAVAALSSLELLDICHNAITVLEPVEDFSRLTKLTRLLMHDMGLRRIDKDGIFHGMECLEELDLSRNKLTTLPRNTFHGLPSLRTVLLGQNKLQSLPINIFSNTTTLDHIDLSHNKLEYLSTLSVTTMSKESISSQNVHLENNPWYCDSNLCPLMDWYSKLQQPVSTPAPNCTCQTPSNMTFHQAISMFCVKRTETSPLEGTDDSSNVSYGTEADQTVLFVVIAAIVLFMLVMVGVIVYHWKKKRAQSPHIKPYHFTSDIRRQYLEDLQGLLSRPDSSEPVYETIDNMRCPSSVSSHMYAVADDDLDTRSMASTGTYLSFPGQSRCGWQSATSLSVIDDEDDTKTITSHHTYLSLLGDTDSIDSQPVHLPLIGPDVNTSSTSIHSSMDCDEGGTENIPGQPVYNFPKWKGYFPREKSTLSSITCASHATVSKVILEDLKDNALDGTVT